MNNTTSIFTQLEKGIKVFKIFLFSLSLALFIGNSGWWPVFYSPIALGFAFLASAVIIIISSHAFNPIHQDGKEAAVILRFVIALALTLNAIGELYLYQLYRLGLPYDKFLHFTVAFLFVMALANYHQMHYGFSFKKAIVEAVIIVLLCSLLWEVAEYLSDTIFHTKEFGIYGERKFFDTSFDLVSDLAGVISSSLILISPVLHSVFMSTRFKSVFKVNRSLN